jgi:integral membrane protein (TIGR01906 family)
MKKALLTIFIILLPLFLLLFSYKTIFFLYPLTDTQQNAVDFLDEKAELQGNYTMQEVSHLEDVKQVMNGIDYVSYGLLLILTLIITYYKKNLTKLFRYGGIATCSTLALLLLLNFLNFNTLFTYFHKLFFPQGNWQFPVDSFILQTFPLEFFIAISVRIFALTLIFGILCIVLSKYTTKFK